MKIEPGQYIKVLFRHNGLALEGIVESWEPDNYLLRSLSDESLMIILCPQDDIMVIKIMPVPEPRDVEEIVVKQGAMPKINDTSQKLDKIDPAVVASAIGAEEIAEHQLRAKRLAELHVMKIKAEREIIANKLKDHNIGETRKVEYGLPGFFKKPSAK